MSPTVLGEVADISQGPSEREGEAAVRVRGNLALVPMAQRGSGVCSCPYPMCLAVPRFFRTATLCARGLLVEDVIPGSFLGDN